MRSRSYERLRTTLPKRRSVSIHLPELQDLQLRVLRQDVGPDARSQKTRNRVRASPPNLPALITSFVEAPG